MLIWFWVNGINNLITDHNEYELAIFGEDSVMGYKVTMIWI